MFLEIFTLLTLVVMLLIKYAIAIYTSNLNRRLTEMENNCNRTAHRYQALSKQREALETEERSLQSERRLAEKKLDDIQLALMEQQQRNKEMEERIGTLV